MRINDKLLTFVTGVVLAVGGGAASLFLGDHGAEVGYKPNLTIASLSVPSIPTQEALPAQIRNDATISRTTPTLPTAEPETRVILAALEPATQKNDTGSGLFEIAVLDGAPELAKPAEFSDIVLTRSFSEVPAPEMTRVATGLPSLKIDIAEQLNIPQINPISCDLDIRATPIFGARVQLKLTAPCHPNVIATIKHGGLQFKEVLDESGVLAIKVPAFEEYSRFDIELADGTKTTVGAYVAGMTSLERVGISWNGTNDTFLHAYQAAAKAGSDGHIWRLNTRSFAKARMSGGGYMTLLGNPDVKGAMLAQVYTLPATKRTAGQMVSLEIETLRGESACGENMHLKIALHRAKSGAAQSGLALVLPKCGAANSSLVLKNILKDMKVARK